MAGQRPLTTVLKKNDPTEEKLVRSIQEVGPRNIAQLSRMTGAHPETIRYKVKRQFKKLGIRIHAEADYRKLGLVPIWADVSFSPKFGGSTEAVFLALNKYAYLVYYGKLLPQGSFTCMFAVPEGKRSQQEELLAHMKRSGILSSFAMNETAVSRINRMDPRFFDFQSGAWQIDWGSVKQGGGSEMKIQGTVQPERIDLYDLLLIKELQKDSLQHLVSIAKKVKVHAKTLEYHYRAHVQKEELVSSYYLRWMRDIERSVAHSVLVTKLTFRDLSGAFKRVQRVVSKIPFLWAEYVFKDGTYVVFLDIPIREAMTTLDYLNSEVPDLAGKVEMSYVKRKEACLFTIPYEMFKDGWSYDLKKAKSAVSAIQRKKG
jgi:DNA-binding Lrp family transcriptional regulator